MSPILDLQSRLREAGRIRIGTSKPREKGGKLPVRLDTFRLTSKDETLIRAVAELYGGEPQPWEDQPGQWEVITEADELRVVLIPVPGGAISQWYEQWGQPLMADGKKGATSCLRRCDGFEQTSGEPCSCPADPEERAQLAKKGKACAMYTRLSVLLPDVPTMGCWRLESQGYYAASELGAAVTLIDNALANSGLMIAARLRLEQRSATSDGQTLKFPVPALDIADRLDRIAALAQGGAQPLAALERPPGAELEQAIAAADARAQEGPRRQGKQAAPIGPPASPPTTKPIESDGERAITPPPKAPPGPPPPTPEHVQEQERKARTEMLLEQAAVLGIRGQTVDAIAKNRELDANPERHIAWLQRQTDEALRAVQALREHEPPPEQEPQPAQEESLFQAPSSVHEDRG